MKKYNENLTVCININNSLAKIMKIFFKLCILVFIPYTILCMTLGWGEWWYFLYPPSQKFFIPEITLITGLCNLHTSILPNRPKVLFGCSSIFNFPFRTSLHNKAL